MGKEAETDCARQAPGKGNYALDRVRLEKL
jgi:hypothetical protein